MNRLKFVYLLFISVLLFSCKSDGNRIKFEISGNLESYGSEDILLQSDDIKTLFIAEKQNGNFYIRSKKNLPIGLYYLKIGENQKRIPILIDNTDISVYLNNLNLDGSHTSGTSDYQNIYSSYKSATKTTNNLFAYQKVFIEKNKNTELSAIVLKEVLGKTEWRLEQCKILFEQLTPFIQKSDLGKEIDTYITAGLETIKKENNKKEQSTEEVIIGKPKPQTNTTPKPAINLASEITDYAPFFYADNLIGTEISAKAVFNNNKFTLLDFWASWCMPCRAQNPDLVRLYNKYHAKGFEILSISEDKDINDWQVAVTVDKMNWLHVKDDYKRIANMYEVKAIPYALLVNNQGGIITKKISISRLESLLQTEFGN